MYGTFDSKSPLPGLHFGRLTRGRHSASAWITATPGTMRPLGESLHRDTGFTVYAPLLPGHGLTPEEMAKTRWFDWFRASQQAFDKLSRGAAA